MIKRIQIAYVLCAACTLSLLLSSTPAEAKAKTVYVEVGEVTFANAPLAALSHAIQHNKGATQFRVSWGINGTLMRAGTTVLYDRRHHLLRYHSVTHNRIGEDFSVWREMREHTLYRGVTDAMIKRLKARNDEATSSGEDGFLSHLTSVGAKKQTLNYRQFVYNLRDRK